MAGRSDSLLLEILIDVLLKIHLSVFMTFYETIDSHYNETLLLNYSSIKEKRHRY